VIGRSVARYRIVAKLGDGGMASVWKAEDTLLGRPVALKVLGADMRESPDVRRRFLREARNASALDHPGICGVHDAGEADGEVFMALTFIDGRTISALAERAPLSIADVLHVAVSAAEALGHAHARGIVHRDITGRNIMMARDGRVMVLDFGLALAAGVSRMTTSGARLGTVAYLSPEVAAGRDADARSDLYGLGVVLYEALTGTLPFTAARSEGLLYSIVHVAPDPPNRRRRDVPAGIERIVLRLLAKDPAERFQSATDLLDALRSLPAVATRGAEAPEWADEPALPGTPEPQRYVAVFPFELTSDADADATTSLVIGGLADVVASALARVPSLHVVPPALAGREPATADHQLTARRLGASLLLRTSVRAVGGRLRLTWGLLDVRRGVQIGGETLERVASEVFDLEDRMIAGVREALGEPPTDRPIRPRDPAARERYAQAIGYLQRSDDASVDAAVRILETLQESEDASTEFEAALGRAYMHKYRLTHEPRWERQAASACERVLAADPAGAEALLTLGDLCEATGQMDRAIESYERALALVPGRPEAMIGLGRTCIAAGRLEDAERTLRQSVSLRPDYWDTHNALGRFFLRVGRYEEARVEFEHVRRLTPDNLSGLLNLTAALYELERFAEAEETIRRAIEIHPTPRALSNLGTILHDMGRFEESVDALERAANLQPADAHMWGNLGSSCRRLPGYEQRARNALERAVTLGRTLLEVNPRHATNWSQMGSWLANLNRFEQAVEAAERSLALEPANPEIMFVACCVYCLAGDRDKAFHWMREALAHGIRPARFEREPDLAHLREDPRFRETMEEAGRADEGAASE